MARRHPLLLSPRPHFPPDFPTRLERFKNEAGLSWRMLARAVYVSPRRVHYWRRGVLPDTVHFYQLLTLAEELGLREVLLREDSPRSPNPEEPDDDPA